MISKGAAVRLYETMRSSYGADFGDSALVCKSPSGIYTVPDYLRAVRLFMCLEEGLREWQNRYGGDVSELRRSVHTVEDAKRYIHPLTWFRHSMDSPCLCTRWDELGGESQDAILRSDRWIATEKIRGVRYMFGVSDIGGWRKTAMYARGYSETDGSLVDVWPQMSWGCSFPTGGLLNYIIDVEVCYPHRMEWLEDYGVGATNATDAVLAILGYPPSLTHRIFERFWRDHHRPMLSMYLLYPLYCDKRNFVRRSMGEGYACYTRAFQEGIGYGLPLQMVRSVSGGKEAKDAFLQSVLSSGGEGVVYANLDGHYLTSHQRSKDVWVKRKRYMVYKESRPGLGDTLDCFVTGGVFGKRKDGWGLRYLETSLIVDYPDGHKQTQVMAYVKPPKEWLKEHDDVVLIGVRGEPILNPAYRDMVVEVSGDYISNRNYHVHAPSFVRWRPDKMRHECVYNYHYIMAAAK